MLKKILLRWLLSVSRSAQQDGFLVSVVAFFVLVIMLSIGISMSSVAAYRQKMSTNAIKSTQSYYAAEAGGEDALMRLRNNPSIASAVYTIDVGGATATVTIPDVIGGARAVASEGSNSNIKRKIQAVYSIDGQGASFHYGAQVGAGGLTMSSGSQIRGNVFSNGNIIGSGTIENSVVVATNGNKIDGPHVKGNVLSYTCRTSIVDGNLTYVTGGTNTCAVAGATTTQSTAITSQPLPITQAQIDDWKTEAASGGTSGSVTVSGTQSLGPKKINGDLIINNAATLKLTGTLYVTGQISLNNGATIKLDASYGPLGGVVVADGHIGMSNNSISAGTGQAGSYLVMISTSSASDAISLSNNVNGSIFYTSAGGINVNNNAQTKEVTGYSITLQNNAIIQYDNGLENMFFSDGPSGSWRVSSWGEK